MNKNQLSPLMLAAIERKLSEYPHVGEWHLVQTGWGIQVRSTFGLIGTVDDGQAVIIYDPSFGGNRVDLNHNKAYPHEIAQ